MVRAEIEDEIRSLRREIEIWQEKRNQAVRGRDETDAAVRIICKKKTAIETELHDTFRNVSTSLEKITGKPRFKERYLENVRGILWGAKASEAITSISSAERDAKNKILEYEDIVEECNNKIYVFEQEIGVLMQQLNQIGE